MLHHLLYSIHSYCKLQYKQRLSLLYLTLYLLCKQNVPKSIDRKKKTHREITLILSNSIRNDTMIYDDDRQQWRARWPDKNQIRDSSR